MNEPSVASASSAVRINAFGGVIELYQAPIIRYLFRLTGSYKTACALAQDTFVQVYFETLQNESAIELKASLYRTATSVALPLLTRKKALPFIPFIRQNQPLWHIEEKPFELDADRARLQKTLLTLPAEQRACLLLHFVEGFSYQSISEILSLPPATVRTRICAGKHAFRENENSCAEMDGLLSAYADRELQTEEKSAVDRHVAICTPCRAALRDYTLIREKLASLWAMPPVQDIRPAVLLKIKDAKIPEPRRVSTFPRLATALAAVVVVLVLPFMFSSDLRSGTPADIYRMSEAVKGITSYTITITDDTQPPHVSYTVRMSESSLQYAGAGTYRITTNIPISGAAPFTREIIVSGNKVYATWSSNWGASQAVTPSILDASRALYDPHIAELLVDVARRQDEVIAGIDCYHYRAKMDMDKFIDQQVSLMKAVYEEQGMSFDKQTEQRLEAYWGKTDITVEFWIGKIDYLPRQTRVTYVPQNGRPGPYTDMTTTQYSGFNQPIEIKPPVTDYGELMEGWTISTTGP